MCVTCKQQIAIKQLLAAAARQLLIFLSKYPVCLIALAILLLYICTYKYSVVVAHIYFEGTVVDVETC